MVEELEARFLACHLRLLAARDRLQAGPGSGTLRRA